MNLDSAHSRRSTNTESLYLVFIEHGFDVGATTIRTSECIRTEKYVHLSYCIGQKRTDRLVIGDSVCKRHARQRHHYPFIVRQGKSKEGMVGR